MPLQQCATESPIWEIPAHNLHKLSATRPAECESEPGQECEAECEPHLHLSAKLNPHLKLNLDLHLS